MQASDLVVRFVRSIGRPAEAEYYLSLFRAERRESFAIIAVADAVMREAADALALDLRFLAQLGLCPVIVFGVVKPADARRHADAVRAALPAEVRCQVTDPSGAGAVARGGGVALVPMAPDTDSVDARFDALTALAAELASRKILFLGRRSGLQPLGRAPLSLVDLTTEYDALIAPGVLADKQAALLRQIRRMTDALRHPHTVAVTSPLDLLRELFTVRGAGTLIRRGSAIARHDGFDTCDQPRLRALIEAAFERPLAADFFARPVRSVYVADDYRGAAVVAEAPLSPYLTKFAVDARAQGEGVGRDLWRALDRELPALLWRSRSDNPITAWYRERCDGMVRSGPWHVFWRGLADADIAAAVAHARQAPIDFDR